METNIESPDFKDQYILSKENACFICNYIKKFLNKELIIKSTDGTKPKETSITNIDVTYNAVPDSQYLELKWITLQCSNNVGPLTIVKGNLVKFTDCGFNTTIFLSHTHEFKLKDN